MIIRDKCDTTVIVHKLSICTLRDFILKVKMFSVQEENYFNYYVYAKYQLHYHKYLYTCAILPLIQIANLFYVLLLRSKCSQSERNL